MVRGSQRTQPDQERIINPSAVRLKFPKHHEDPSNFPYIPVEIVLLIVLCSLLPSPLHPPRSLMVVWYIRFGGSWMCAAVAEDSSTWLTGRDLVLRSGPGSLGPSSWTSKVPIQISLVGCKEARRGGYCHGREVPGSPVADHLQ